MAKKRHTQQERLFVVPGKYALPLTPSERERGLSEVEKIQWKLNMVFLKNNRLPFDHE